MAIELEGEFIGIVTKVSQPFGVLNDSIKIIAMGYPQALAIGGGMNGFTLNIYATKLVTDKCPCEFIVVTGYKDHAVALAHPTQ